MLAALGALAAGCKSVEVPKVPGITPYRMVIQQGNFVSDEMVAQLKPGMTREQVRFVLGTPLVTDIFHADRWDYVFYRELPNGKREQRNLTVVFEDGKLARVIGDLLPAPGAAPKPAAETKPEAKPAAEAQPAAEARKPDAEAPKPAPQQAGENWAPTQQNWGTASDVRAEPKPEAKQEEKTAEEEKKPEEPKKERGFFGRMLEKIGL
jgi:outer membrane protein assembly factor BamE